MDIVDRLRSGREEAGRVHSALVQAKAFRSDLQRLVGAPFAPTALDKVGDGFEAINRLVGMAAEAADEIERLRAALMK